MEIEQAKKEFSDSMNTDSGARQSSTDIADPEGVEDMDI